MFSHDLFSKAETCVHDTILYLGLPGVSSHVRHCEIVAKHLAFTTGARVVKRITFVLNRRYTTVAYAFREKKCEKIHFPSVLSAPKTTYTGKINSPHAAHCACCTLLLRPCNIARAHIVVTRYDESWNLFVRSESRGDSAGYNVPYGFFFKFFSPPSIFYGKTYRVACVFGAFSSALSDVTV